MNNQVRIEQLIEAIAAEASTAQLQIDFVGLDLNEVGLQGRTPLMVAAGAGLLTTAELLVRNGASIHATGHYQMTALHEAAANGETAVVRYLLSLGGAVNAETRQGVTPLMCAAAGGHVEAVRLLLENGADRTKTDRTGATAGDVALEKGENTVADLINSYPQRSAS